MIKRIYLLAAIFAFAAVFARVGVSDSGPKLTETWMEQHSVTKFLNYKMVPGEGPDRSVTYKMLPTTYETLQPDGIVCRELSNGQEAYDVVLIGSKAKASFHDPRVCFTAQGYQLDSQEGTFVQTKTRGRIPVIATQIESDQGKRWAAFFYRGPEGFVGSTDALKLQMFKYSLLKGKNADGVFYRFIAGDADISKEHLLSFVGRYLDASKSQFGEHF